MDEKFPVLKDFVILKESESEVFGYPVIKRDAKI